MSAQQIALRVPFRILPATWEAQVYTATIHLGPLIWYDRLELSSVLLLLTFPHKLTA